MCRGAVREQGETEGAPWVLISDVDGKELTLYIHPSLGMAGYEEWMALHRGMFVRACFVVEKTSQGTLNLAVAIEHGT